MESPGQVAAAFHVKHETARAPRGPRRWAVLVGAPKETERAPEPQAFNPTGSGLPAPVAYVSRKISMSIGLSRTTSSEITAWSLV